MKNISLIKVFVMGAAIVALFILHFTSGSVDSPSDATGVTEETVDSVVKTEFNSSIAIVNLDTILENYKFYKDKVSELERETRRLEGEFNTEQTRLQGKIDELQTKASKHLITSKDYELQYAALLQEGQGLQQKGQQLSRQLAEQEQVMVNNIMYNISTYLEKSAAHYHYEVVLGKSSTSPVLYGNDTLDITKEVILGLNKTYAEGK